MTTTTDNSIRDPTTGTLTALRALAVEPVMSIAGARSTAEAQAQLLQDLLLPRTDQLGVAHLVDLVPGILIEYVDDMPVAGISFWGRGHWHIHVRTNDRVDSRVFTVLHQLKHIIDHPLRRQWDSFSEADWEALANHFAFQVLAQEPGPVTTSGGRSER